MPQSPFEHLVAFIPFLRVTTSASIQNVDQVDKDLHACAAWELAAESYLLKLQPLQNKVLRTTGNLSRSTPTRDLHMTFKIPYFDFVTKLCRQQVTIILSHENVNTPNTESTNCSSSGDVRHRTDEMSRLLINPWAGIICYTNPGVYTDPLYLNCKEMKKKSEKIKTKMFIKQIKMYVCTYRLTQVRTVTHYITDASSRQRGCPKTNKNRATVLTTGAAQKRAIVITTHFKKIFLYNFINTLFELITVGL
jgi:hypothetical protein